MNLDNKVIIDQEEGEVLKFTIIGDCHFNHATPKSRIDDYASTCVDKLESLRVSMLERGSKYLIMVGDIFHKPKQPVEFLVRIIQGFIKFKESGIRVFSIVGNHCEIFDRLDSLERTSLGLLFETGVIEHLDSITIRSKERVVNILGCDYPNDLPEVTDFKAYNIAVAHKFYEFDLSDESLQEKDLEKYGFNMLVLGHDHVPYDLKTVDTKMGKVRIVRPGSFMRGTSHSYNTKRRVYTDTIEFNGTIRVIRDVLPVKSPEEIFSSSVMDKVDTKDLNKDLSRRFIELVTKIYNSDDNGMNVYNIIDDTSIDPAVKNRIELYLESAGIFRKTVEN